MFLQNIRSLPRNFEEFELEIEQLAQRPDIICLTETWLKNISDNDIFQIQGYEPLYSCARIKRGGGIGIYVNTGSDHRIIKQKKDNNIQILSVLIKPQINQKLVVTCVYIPPNSLNNATFESLQNYLHGLTLGPETDHIVCGDFNVNFLLNSTKRKKIEDIMIGNGMLENKMSCLPTRVTERSSTLIDLFFCTSSFSTKTIKNSVSDHFGVQFFSNFLKKDVFTEKTFARNWNKLKKRDISEKLSFYLQHEIGKRMSSRI